MIMFYLLNTIIGAYFLLTTAALFSPAAAGICVEFYDKVDYSIEAYRSMWVGTTALLMVGYCYMWFQI